MEEPLYSHRDYPTREKIHWGEIPHLRSSASVQSTNTSWTPAFLKVPAKQHKMYTTWTPQSAVSSSINTVYEVWYGINYTNVSHQAPSNPCTSPARQRADHQLKRVDWNTACGDREERTLPRLPTPPKQACFIHTIYSNQLSSQICRESIRHLLFSVVSISDPLEKSLYILYQSLTRASR